jgi:methylenetetrahydrofolate reductase (NADPH)
MATARQLASYNPDFFSCTYGAGGSTRDRTLNTVLQLESEVKVPAAPHLSCVGDSKDDLRGLLAEYKAAGIKRIVALRGDLPSGMGMASGELRYANDLVSSSVKKPAITSTSKWPLTRRCTPGAQLRRRSANFVRKAKAGADSAITQYFFNADSYFYFVERARAGRGHPGGAGHHADHQLQQAGALLRRLRCEIPRWIRKQLEAYGDDTASIQAFGEQVISEMCERLLQGGAPGCTSIP